MKATNWALQAATMGAAADWTGVQKLQHDCSRTFAGALSPRSGLFWRHPLHPNMYIISIILLKQRNWLGFPCMAPQFEETIAPCNQIRSPEP
jgi:hypothetical protein